MKSRVLTFILFVLLGAGLIPAAAQESDTRIFTDDRGHEVEIPVNPQRVVALDDRTIEAAASVGASLVGAVGRYPEQIVPPIFEPLVEGVVNVGTTPNFEAILDLQPDLIIGQPWMFDGIEDQMRQIAPVVMLDYWLDETYTTTQWETHFRRVADATGRAAEAEAQLARLEEALAAFAADFPADPADVSVSAVNLQETQWFIFTELSFAGEILDRLGFARPEAQVSSETDRIYLSYEEIALADGDIILSAVDREEYPEGLPDITGGALWQSLGAVRAGDVYEVDGFLWLVGGSVPAGLAILDDLRAVFDMPAVGGDAAAFPVTVEHKFGATTIEAEPQRIVAIGYTEQDYLVALGVAPVAVRSWYADESIAYLPWALDEAEAIGSPMPEILVMPFGSLNYEAILALEPDLISAVTAGITQEEYDLLSAIAPTVAQSPFYVDFGMPWQEITRTIGLSVGRAEQAEALVADVEGLIADVREVHPEFEGRTIAVAYNYGEARTYGYYTGQDARGRFFTDLGFVVPDELNEIAGDSFFADISAERIDLLEQDVLVFLGLAFSQGGREAIENDPLIRQLDAFEEGRVVFIPAEYDDALQYSSVLSLEYALEGIVPELARAVNGG
jgi:iron complex transport system substrate-binding protein